MLKINLYKNKKYPLDLFFSQPPPPSQSSQIYNLKQRFIDQTYSLCKERNEFQIKVKFYENPASLRYLQTDEN